MGTSAPAARPLGRTGCRGSEITEVRTQYPRTLTGLGSRRRCVERNTIPLSLRGNLGGARIADTAWMGNSKQFALFYEETTRLAIGAFFDVYNELGGFPEFVLRRGLAVALADAGLVVREEVSLPVWFRGRRLTTFKADLIIDPGVIIEVKTAPELLAVNKAQLMHYLKATGLELGLLFNFGRHPEFARVIQQKRSA